MLWYVRKYKKLFSLKCNWLFKANIRVIVRYYNICRRKLQYYHNRGRGNNEKNYYHVNSYTLCEVVLY